MLTDKEISDIEARMKAARPSPWKSFVEGRDHSSGSNFIQISDGKLEDLEANIPPEDQDFIANARQDIPKLIEEVRRLRTELASNTRGNKND